MPMRAKGPAFYVKAGKQLVSSSWKEVKPLMKEKSKPTADEKADTAFGFKVKLDRPVCGRSPGLWRYFSADNPGQFAVHGIEVKHSAKGPFVQMPQVSYKSKGNIVYQDTFHPITAESRQALYDAVMERYQQARAEERQQEQEEPENEAPGQQPVM